jgi:uncharacterized membrane protein
MVTLEINPGELSTAQVWGSDARPVPVGQHYRPLLEKEQDGMLTAHAVQTISRDPEQLYRLWRDISLIPRWQERVISVTELNDILSHWVLGDPEEENGERLEFDSEIVEDIPAAGLSWQSTAGDIKQSGSVTFVASSSGRGTVVTLVQRMNTPGGSKLSSAMTGEATRSPEQTIIENLRHFKQLAETGEIPSVKGQPRGPRGLSGGFKEWLYGENNPTPPGTSDQA